MPVSQNVGIIQNIYEGFGRRDFGVIARYFDPDVEIYQTEALPWGGQYHGHEGVSMFFMKLLASIESHVEIGELIDAGDHVVETGRTRGQSRQTGEAFDVAEVHIWKLKDGKVVAFRAYIDTPSMAAAIQPSAQ